jgi:protein TonB
VKLGSVLTETIKSDYNIEPELKQIQDNGNSILILKKATVPAVLIECGYMDNPADMKYLQDDKNQEKIARDILEAIKKYNLATAIPVTETSPTGTGKQNEMVTQTSNMEIAVTTVSKVNETASDSSGPLKKVEVQADFPGGVEGWKAYLTKNLKYPDDAVNNEVQGEVIVQFVVNTDGSLSDVHAISGPSRHRAESVRVVKESGHWIPAKDKGVTVASFKKQPIDYKLEISKG